MSSPNYELTELVARQLEVAVSGGRVILTRGGRPIAYILPTAIYDEEDIGYMTDPAFWKMIHERRDDPMIPLEEVLRELELREAAEADAATNGKKDHATA